MLQYFLISFCLKWFICFWPQWVFVSVPGLSLVVASEDCSPLWCPGFLLRWLLSLQSMGSRHTGFGSYIPWLSTCNSQSKLLCSMCDLPGPGIDPVSPAVVGGFLNTGLPGKSKNFLISLKEKISLPFPCLFFN